MISFNHPGRFFLLATVLLLCIAGTGPATVIFSDSFDYSAGALAGKGPPAGGTGGQGDWTNVSSTPQVTAGGLAYPGVASGINKATIAGQNANLGDDADAATSQVR